MENDEITLDEKSDRGKIPDQKELEKELSDYLSKKYGNRVKIISPLVFPKVDQISSDKSGKETDSGDVPAFEMLPEDFPRNWNRIWIVLLSSRNRPRWFCPRRSAPTSTGSNMPKSLRVKGIPRVSV